MPYRFKLLNVGDTFDFINDTRRDLNSFYDRCRKISTRKYESIETGLFYQVGSINCVVFHVVKT